MCVDAIATVATVAVVGVAFAGVDNVGSAMGSAGGLCVPLVLGALDEGICVRRLVGWRYLRHGR